MEDEISSLCGEDKVDGIMERAMAAINNLVVSLLNNQGFLSHAQAHRKFDASPAKALALICGL